MSFIRITLFLFVLLLCATNASAVEIEQVDIYVQENGDASLRIKYSLGYDIGTYILSNYEDTIREQISIKDEYGTPVNIKVIQSKTDIENNIIWLMWYDFANVELGAYNTPKISYDYEIDLVYIIFPDRYYTEFKTTKEIKSVKHKINPVNLLPIQRIFGETLDESFWTDMGTKYLELIKIEDFGFSPGMFVFNVAAEVSGSGYYDPLGRTITSMYLLLKTITNWNVGPVINAADNTFYSVGDDYSEIEQLINNGKYKNAVTKIGDAQAKLRESKKKINAYIENYENKAASSDTTVKVVQFYRQISPPGNIILNEMGEKYKFTIPLNKYDSSLAFKINTKSQPSLLYRGKYKINMELESKQCTKVRNTESITNSDKYTLSYAAFMDPKMILKNKCFLEERISDDMSVDVIVTVEKPYKSWNFWTNDDKYVGISYNVYSEAQFVEVKKDIYDKMGEYENLKFDQISAEIATTNIDSVVEFLEVDKKLLQKWIDEGIIQNSED